MKQVLLLRTDIDMSRGKAVAQGSHVSVLATQEADEKALNQWIENGGKKITLAVESEEELRTLVEEAYELPTAIISDLGHTELEPGTTTAGAIGPAAEEDIDEFTSGLSLYN